MASQQSCLKKSKEWNSVLWWHICEADGLLLEWVLSVGNTDPARIGHQCSSPLTLLSPGTWVFFYARFQRAVWLTRESHKPGAAQPLGATAGSHPPTSSPGTTGISHSSVYCIKFYVQ